MAQADGSMQSMAPKPSDRSTIEAALPCVKAETRMRAAAIVRLAVPTNRRPGPRPKRRARRSLRWPPARLPRTPRTNGEAA